MSDKTVSEDDALYSRIGAGGESHAVMLEQAARIAQLGYFVFNVQESIVELCSVRHAAIFGQTPSDFIESVSGLKGPMTMIHPEDRNILREAYQRLVKGETIEMEYRFYRADRSIGYIRETVAPDYDATGEVVRGLGSSLDVTHTRRAEERKAQANRLAALGELTAGVAHDVNNILAVVMGNAELLQDGIDSALPSQLLSEIVSAARRGGTLTQSLLNFAQRATIRPVPLDLGEETARAVVMFERTSLKKPTIAVGRGKPALPIFADRDNLQSVILNILINARDAIREGGSIRITSELQSVPKDAAPALPPAGEYACLTIQDDGMGIPPHNLARVTEPFFTTKSRSEGSGLGLSMAAGFMRQLGGEIVITSEPGAGTCVRLFFPLHRDRLGRGDATAFDAPSTFDKRHVLLLEDEDAIRNVLHRNLTRWGFTVTAASTGEEAVAAVAAHRFDLALLDNYFPGDLSGVDIAALVKGRTAATPVILLTGMARLDNGADRAVIDLVLAKPIPAAELRARIAGLLETVHPPRSEPA
ncbi:ATP-binding protein [Antarctobacter sp.]|uniref:ATP-binding protein n=1 Tax=Antarctobacter sp. TaxID=1872577 RepID=UPI003A8CED22